MKSISFVTNVGPGTLEYVKLLLRSLKENLDSQDHEILVFVDRDTDGVTDYLRSVKKDFKDLKIITHKVYPIVGYQRNSNILVRMAKHDIVSYLQSDMIVAKHYDTNILEDLEENMILSSTRVEPPLHPPSPTTFTVDFGVDPESFQYDTFVAQAETFKKNHTIEYFFAPFTFYKKTWLDIGGYDTLFRRSREDSDLLQRFKMRGVQIKQTFKAIVYHFTCVSSRGKDWFNRNNKEAQNKASMQSLADQIEMAKFVRKWGGFSHGDKTLAKYDIDLVIKGDAKDKFSLITGLEPFVSRVWVETEGDKEMLLKVVSHYDNMANWLLGFRDKEEDWNKAKHLYNQVNFEKRFQVGEPKNFYVKITLTLSNTPIDKQDEFLANLAQLHDILKETEPGTYELGAAVLEIKGLLDLTPANIKVSNPHFSTSLLTVE